MAHPRIPEIFLYLQQTDLAEGFPANGGICVFSGEESSFVEVVEQEPYQTCVILVLESMNPNEKDRMRNYGTGIECKDRKS